jgi:hypothetical protein
MLYYLDESDDTGFNFTSPFRKGGSSRYLTICVVQTPKNLAALPGQIISNLKQKYGWSIKEKKGSSLSDNQKDEFITLAIDLITKNPEICFHAITVFKPNVQQHIRLDPNKLYNYMVRLLLTGSMAEHQQVTLAHDQRSVQVASGNSLHDYLQTILWLELGTKTVLTTRSLESHKNNNILFVDYLTHICWAEHEDGKPHFAPLKSKVHNKFLFFP